MAILTPLLLGRLVHPFPVSSFVEGTLVYVSVLSSIASLFGLSLFRRTEKLHWAYDISTFVTTNALTCIITWIATGWTHVFSAYAVFLVATVSLSKRLFRFDAWTQIRIIAGFVQVLLAPMWAISIISRMEISFLTKSLLGFGWLAGTLRLPFAFGTVWIEALALGRRIFTQPRAALPLCNPADCPKVSVQIPCYSEPPTVVIQTLEAIKNADYPADKLEILVVDNNTSDPALWKPVEAWCAEVGGPQFRFFHVSPLRGAKPGAQNFALREMDGDLICCLDADFCIDPDFLRRFVGFFADRKVGAVQSAPDFRDCNESAYMRLIYWLYMVTYRVDQPLRNEIDSSFLVGSANLIRRTALEEVGGWAEWAVCEDTELSMRLQGHGYQVLAIPTSFSTGMMPDNFDDLRQQWFRWYSGSYQQFRHNWRMLLPQRFGGCRMTPMQKYWEAYRIGQPMISAVVFVMQLALALISAAVCIGHFEYVPLPRTVVLFVLCGVPSSLVLPWMYMRRAGAGIKELLSIMLVSTSLAHVHDVAMLKGAFSPRPPKWVRTSKFRSKAVRDIVDWVSSVGYEWIRGILTMLFCFVVCFTFYRMHSSEVSFGLVALVCLIGMAGAFFSFVVAPFVMVVLAHEHQKLKDVATSV